MGDPSEDLHSARLFISETVSKQSKVHNIDFTKLIPNMELREVIFAVSLLENIDPMFSTLVAYSVLAACASKAYHIEGGIKGKKDEINLFTLLSAPSSSGKSSIFIEFSKPITWWCDKEDESLKERIQEYNKENKDNPSYQYVHMLASDPTPEGLFQILVQKDKAFLLSSEGNLFNRLVSNPHVNLDLFINSFQAERTTKNTQEAYRLKEKCIAKRPILDVLICVQPEILEKVFSSPHLGDRGFLSRFLTHRARALKTVEDIKLRESLNVIKEKGLYSFYKMCNKYCDTPRPFWIKPDGSHYTYADFEKQEDQLKKRLTKRIEVSQEASDHLLKILKQNRLLYQLAKFDNQVLQTPEGDVTSIRFRDIQKATRLAAVIALSENEDKITKEYIEGAFDLINHTSLETEEITKLRPVVDRFNQKQEDPSEAEMFILEFFINNNKPVRTWVHVRRRMSSRQSSLMQQRRKAFDKCLVEGYLAKKDELIVITKEGREYYESLLV